MAPRPVSLAPRPATVPVDLGSYHYVSDLMKFASTAPPALPKHPAIILGRTLVFAMEKPACWDEMDNTARWALKKDYLETTYQPSLLFFEEDGELIDAAATRIHIPKHDYYARFEVAGHPNSATQFTASMILLELGGMVGLPTMPQTLTPLFAAPIHTAVAAPVSTPAAPPAIVPAATPVPSAAVKMVFAPRPHIPPVKFVRTAHCDVATSVATFARAAVYKRVKEEGLVKRNLCVQYAGRVEVDGHR